MSDSKKEVRLLIIQECDEFRTLLEDWIDLNAYHFKISLRTTESGQTGGELINSWVPSVVLLDAHLTDHNSFSLIDQCRRTCVPVFVVSSQQSSEIEVSARQSGASGYFPANGDPEMIDLILGQIVEASQLSLGTH